MRCWTVVDSSEHGQDVEVPVGVQLEGAQSEVIRAI